MARTTWQNLTAFNLGSIGVSSADEGGEQKKLNRSEGLQMKWILWWEGPST